MSDQHLLSRRDLLRRAGGATATLAVPTILTGNALGAPGVEPASERLRLGFIGVKNRGMQNLAPLMKHAVAVCDVDRSVLAAARARVEKANGACEAFTDYRKLLERKDIDAVVISTPDHWHALQTIHACEAGKDVFCEKPLTLVVAEGQAMVKTARRTGRIVQTGSQQRSDDRFRQACELVRSGRLGKIHTVKVGLPGVNFDAMPVPDGTPPAELDYNFWLGPAPERPYNVNRVHYNFRFFWNYSGGQMTNWGAHHLDIAQWGLGMDESGPISASATAEYDPAKRFEVPTKYLVTYRYASGITMLCGAGQGFKNGTLFEGERGSLFVTRGKIESTPAELLMEPSAAGDVRLYESKDHYGNWLECVRSRKLPICDVAIGHRSASVCHIGNIAIRTGRPVRWDPVKEAVIGDAEQQALVSYAYRAPWKL